MDTKPFDHGYDYESTRAPQGWQIIGYNHAMVQVMDYIKDVTNFKPENRYIDSVLLLEKVAATLKAVSALYDERKKEERSLS